MTQMRVDAAAIRALGEALLGVAADLAAVSLRAGAAEGMPPGRSPAALDAVLGNWLQVRHETAQQVAALGDAAVAAGTAYVQVDEETVGSLVGLEEGS